MNCKKYNGDCLNQSSTCLPITDQPWNLETSPLSSKAPSTSNIQRLGITTKYKSGHVIQLVALIFKVLNRLASALSPILTTVLCDLLLVLKRTKPVPHLTAFAFTALPAWSMPPPILPTSGSFSSFRSQLKCNLLRVDSLITRTKHRPLYYSHHLSVSEIHIYFFSCFSATFPTKTQIPKEHGCS